MREYLSISNFRKALVLGSAMALMSVPRIIIAGIKPVILIASAFAAMTLCSGAATAWGEKGGMTGLFPFRKRALIGMALALILTVIAVPAYTYIFDPILISAITAKGDTKWLLLKYPPDVYGRIALILWSASFETIFFRAGAMSFFARVTGRQWTAILLGAIFRVFVSALQLSASGVDESVPLLLAGSAVMSFFACYLFARYGLPAAMLFSAGLEIRLFLYPG